MDPKLLEILVCPVCKGGLEMHHKEGELVCRPCRLAYAIKDGIPVMLADEARQIAADEAGAA
ncbi:Trm112 family protein [Uliginosibacterium paludis]|uniref:UPF0434 protein ABVT11_11885 n=1 Tax=Uliginosibacterium paludis TaxID=1615952 RepID=A0ABV2CRI2_9RHOO